MLRTLFIGNAAVIRRLELSASGGFTVITGETGSGKSVIIDCLAFLLGGKSKRDMVRSGESKATVSAVFCDFSLETLAALAELGAEPEDGELLLERTLGNDGKSVCRANGRPISRQQLCDIGKLLVSLHSQDDTATLETEKARTEILDSAAGHFPLLSAYKEAYAAYTETRRQLTALQKDEADKEQLRDILTFQIKEISSAKPKSGEEEALLDEKRRIEGSEKLRKCTQTVSKALVSNDKGITAPYLCDRAADAIDKLCAFFPEYASLSERLRACRYELDDIASEAERLANEFGADYSVERLDAVNDRLELLNRLKRKYGGDTDTVLAFLENAKARLDAIENADARKETLEKELRARTKRLTEAAKALHESREAIGKATEEKILSILQYLDMPKVRFSIRVSETAEPGPDGCDRVDFLLAANPGEPMLPLEKCASGGELSRVMLAVRCAVHDTETGNTLVFDEIDTGISGKTSRKVGLKLLEVASGSQVICVTHSAQIASLADTHVKIRKEEKNGRTESSLQTLDRDGRIEEIARILGGIHVTAAQTQAAVDMIDNRKE